MRQNEEKNEQMVLSFLFVLKEDDRPGPDQSAKMVLFRRLEVTFDYCLKNNRQLIFIIVKCVYRLNHRILYSV